MRDPMAVNFCLHGRSTWYRARPGFGLKKIVMKIWNKDRTHSDLVLEKIQINRSTMKLQITHALVFK